MDEHGNLTREEAEKLLSDPKFRIAGREGALHNQMVYLARMQLHPLRCPNCTKSLAVVDAISRRAETGSGDDYECCHCHAKVRYCLSLIGGEQYWTLEPHQVTVKS